MGNQSSANGPREGKPSKSRRQWSDLVEELLEEARERGDFDHLEGKGKPLSSTRTPMRATVRSPIACSRTTTSRRQKSSAAKRSMLI